MAKTEAKTVQTSDVKAEKAAEAAKFPKDKLLVSKRYKHRQDALSFLLKDGESYTFEQTDKLLADFMKGKVN